jgi:hypothetical protein
MLHRNREPILVNLDLVTHILRNGDDPAGSIIEFVNEKTIVVDEHPDIVVD